MGTWEFITLSHSTCVWVWISHTTTFCKEQRPSLPLLPNVSPCQVLNSITTISAQFSFPWWWILPRYNVGAQGVPDLKRWQKTSDSGLCLILGFLETDSEGRGCVQKAYWSVLPGVTPVIKQRDKLTHNELQLISQLIPQGAFGAGMAPQNYPKWGKTVGFLYHCMSQSLATVILQDEAYPGVRQFLQPQAMSNTPPTTNMPSIWETVYQPWRGDLGKAPQYPL